MEDSFKAFEALVRGSTISPEEQEMLLRIFSRAPEEKIKEVVELFTENPAWISKISSNLAAKEKAFASDNPDEWAKILEEEKKELEGLESGK